MQTQKPAIFAFLATMLIISGTGLAHAEFSAPKSVDSDIVAIAKESYTKATLSAKKVYSNEAQKSKAKFDEKREIAQKFWEGILFVVANNDKTILLNAKKVHDTYILKAKRTYDQEIMLAKNIFDDTISQAKVKYSDDLAKAKITK